MSNIKFTMKDLDGTVMPYTSFVISTSTSANAASFTTNLNGEATVSLAAVSTPYYISKQDGTTESVIAYKFFVPESVVTLEAEMLFVDMGKIITDKNVKSIAALIEAKVIAVNAKNEAFKLAQILGVIDNIQNSLSNVTRVKESIGNVDRVYSSIANVDRIFTSIDKVDRVHTSIDKLDRVYTSVDKVDVVYTSIGNVDTVSANITSVNKTAAIDANVTKVANIDINVTKVANIDSNVTKVANIDTNVTKVANIDDDVVLLNTVVISYLGTHTNSPTTRIGGATIQVGDWYIDSSVTPHQIKVCSAINGGIPSFVFVKNMDAEAAKVAAESARDAALVGAGVYATEAAGRAAVADGAAFKVQGSGGVAAFEYRRVSSSESTLISLYPSAEYIRTIRNDLADSGANDYSGAGTVYPLVTDSGGKIIMGFDSSNNQIFGLGLDSMESIGGFGVFNYTGQSVFPVLTDSVGRVLLGYDASKQVVVGAGLLDKSDLPSNSSNKKALVPLADASKPIHKAVNHLLFYGQSLSIGAQGQPVLSTSQPYSNITFNGGPRAYNGTVYDFTAFKPLVEDAVKAPDTLTNRGETPCSGAANWATSLAAEDGLSPSGHVILASTAGIGSATIASIKKGSSWYNSNFIQHITNAKSLNSNYALHAVGWLQGEQDAGVAQTTYAAYRAELKQLREDIDADAKVISGQTSPVYLLSYQLSTSATVWPDQALAQLDLAQKEDKFILVAPCYHLPFNVDGVHLTASGYKWLGAYFGRAYKQLVIDNVRPKWLNPVSATRRGAIIRIRFDVPVTPLVLDTEALAVTIDHGFKVLDGVTPAAIGSIVVDGDDVVITLLSVPSGAVTVRYGLDYLGAGLAFSNGASGNLRDSEPSKILISGVDRPLFNVCPHFQMVTTTLGE